MNVAEFKAWLEGYSHAFPDWTDENGKPLEGGAPMWEHWKLIKEKIDQLEGLPVFGQQWSSVQPLGFVGGAPPSIIPETISSEPESKWSWRDWPPADINKTAKEQGKEADGPLQF